MASPLPPPRYGVGHGLFVASISILIAGGVTAVLFNMYGQAYHIEISQDLKKNISVDALKKALDEKEELILIDVRELDEYADEHIPVSINIPLGTLWNAFESKEIPYAIPIVVYSDDDTRASLTASLLTKEPFALTDVSVVSGGLSAWKAKEYPVYGVLQAEYIDPVEVAKLLRNREKLVFLDVRSEREFMTVHVRNAISIPFEHLPDNVHMLPNDSTIVIIDTPFNEAYGYLESIGFNSIKVLEGGMDRWDELGFAKETNLQTPLSDNESQ